MNRDTLVFGLFVFAVMGIGVVIGKLPTEAAPPPTPWVWAIPTDVVRGCVVDANGNVGPCFEDATP